MKPCTGKCTFRPFDCDCGRYPPQVPPSSRANSLALRLICMAVVISAFAAILILLTACGGRSDSERNAYILNQSSTQGAKHGKHN